MPGTGSAPANLTAMLSQAMPESFPFYHLGHVAAANPALEPADLPLTDEIGIAFTLQGDFRGLLVVILEHGLDTSTYSEMGNIIASRLSTNLREEFQDPLDVMISPPQILGSRQLERLIRGPRDHVLLIRNYVHMDRTIQVNVRTLILASPNTAPDANGGLDA